jgi:hypothetical protein
MKTSETKKFGKTFYEAFFTFKKFASTIPDLFSFIIFISQKRLFKFPSSED